MTSEQIIAEIENIKKFNYTLADAEVFDKAIKGIKALDALDKIRSEIEEELSKDNHSWYKAGMEFCLEIINKHTESEET